jgi:hypothetical protein
MNRTCRVGVHARNDIEFHDADYRIISEAKIETVKMMSQTSLNTFQRLKQLRPDIELITRLFDDRIGKHGHPSPEEFATRMVPIMRQLQPFSTKFEVHNEPNHLDRIEGWGDTDADAQDFNAWFLRVYNILKAQCPWAQLGFPGLAIPHRDVEWVEVCRPAVLKSDWLGVHCYWQTPPHEVHNHLADFWGLRFKYYHQKFPDKIIDLTEVGNSNVQNGIPFTEATHAREYTEYLTECFKYPYLNSVTFFILSSPDPNWDGFAWRGQDDRPHEVVWAIRDMRRPHWVPARKPAPAKPVQPAQPAKPVATTTAVAPQPKIHPVKISARNAPVPSNAAKVALPPPPAPIGVKPAGGQPATRPRPVNKKGKIPAPAVQDIIEQLPRNQAIALPRRQHKQIRQIVVHHTATTASVSAAKIASYLIDRRDHATISYHYFITGAGVIQQCNALTVVTNQSSSQVNPTAVGIGFAGNFTDNPPTPAQIEAGARLIAWLLSNLGLPVQAVSGNKELIRTQSPGNQWDSGAMWGKKLRQRIQAILAGAA